MWTRHGSICNICIEKLLNFFFFSPRWLHWKSSKSNLSWMLSRFITTRCFHSLVPFSFILQNAKKQAFRQIELCTVTCRWVIFFFPILFIYLFLWVENAHLCSPKFQVSMVTDTSPGHAFISEEDSQPFGQTFMFSDWQNCVTCHCMALEPWFY